MEMDKQETEASSIRSLDAARQSANELFNRTGQRILEIDSVS